MFNLGVIPGYRCNFKCAHCSAAGKPWKKLGNGEIANIVEAVIDYNIKSLYFAGGEPTLYIRDINDLLKKIPGSEKISIRITTNGHFAVSQASADKVLRALPNLKHVLLSYDRFHAKFLPLRNVGNLYRACRTRNIPFGVMFAAGSPADMLLVGRLLELGHFKVSVQKVLPSGRAKKTKTSFVYPGFDAGVLKRFCPNRYKITYMCGQGFSSCCSVLVHNTNSSRFFHPKLRQHLESEFYAITSKLSFGKMIKKFGISTAGLGAEHSSPCVLCEYIFRKAYGDKI
jgi:MoaA/NifB/PqqE/SkfB family radical SAM enzyme